MLSGIIIADGSAGAGILVSKAAAADYKAGEIIEYGSYPQTDVSADLGSVLGGQEGEWVSSGRTYTVKVIGEDKAVMKDGSGKELTATISVTVKQGLWNNIIAFFRRLFRMNSVTI